MSKSTKSERRETKPIDKTKAQEQYDEYNNKKEETASKQFDNSEDYFLMKLTKGNNEILLVTDDEARAGKSGMVHEGGGKGYELAKFKINCWRNISEECPLCELHEHYIEVEEYEAARKFKPKPKFTYMCLDWELFDEEPNDCLGDVKNENDKSKYKEGKSKCDRCLHVEVCKERKYSISILKHASPQIFEEIEKIINFPGSDPTDISGARLINIKRNATGMSPPKGMKYYEVEIVSDSDDGKIDLTSKANEWILDVIDETALEDLSVVMEPNTSKKYIEGLLSNEDKGILGITTESDDSSNSESDSKPEECFGNYDEDSPSCQECYVMDDCEEKTKGSE